MLTKLVTAVVRPAFSTFRQEEEAKAAPWALVKAYGVIGLAGYLVMAHFANKDTAEKAQKSEDRLEGVEGDLKALDENIRANVKHLLQVNDNLRGRVAELEERLEDFEVLGGLIEQKKLEVAKRRRVEAAKALVRKYEEAKAIIADEADKPKKGNGAVYDGVGT